ncbi:MAG: thioredoxin family protein [Myxococcales bacterium]|nr:thioredoxin family protein [Myxococcales bacterium]
MAWTKFCRLLVPLAIALVAVGCRDKAATTPADKTADLELDSKTNLCDLARSDGPLAWFHDEYDTAAACAQTKGLPLVIDMWAPWCHTCLSMQATVLRDPALAAYAQRFVWLALDTDRPGNAAAVELFSPAAWPTFFVVDPLTNAIQARFVGSASTGQFIAFLREGETGFVSKAALDPASPSGLLRAAEQAANRSEWEAAQIALTTALATAPADWPRRPDAMVSLLSTMRRAGKWADCLAYATQQLPYTGSSASAADFIAVGRMCVTGLGKRGANAPAVTAFRQAAIARLSGLIKAGAANRLMTIDDVSDAMMNLRGLLDEDGRHEEAVALAQQQRKLLDDAADKASAPKIAMTYNWPRAEAYPYLGVPRELVDALTKSMADPPTEYDPPHRLAWIYLQAKDYALAHQYAMAAYKLGYGVRKTRISKLLIDIATEQDDATALRQARELHLAALTAAPATQQDVAQITEMHRLLSGVGQRQP